MNWLSYTNGFKAYLKLEKSLSPNTIEAYLNDVAKFTAFEGSNLNYSSPSDVNLNDLQSFIKDINKLGLGARSQARIISGLKAF